MRASVPRSTLIKRLSEYLEVDAIRCLRGLDRVYFVGIALLSLNAKSKQERPPLDGLSQLLSLFVHINDALRREGPAIYLPI